MPSERIGPLKAVMKMLLHSDAITSPVDAKWVARSLDDPTHFMRKELETVAYLVNQLRPYSPKKDGRTIPKDAMLCASIVLITDTLLRATGEPKKCREWTPDVRDSSLHGAHITAAVLFQLCCAADPGHFDVLDDKGHVMSYRTNINNEDNKRRIFGSFFNLEHIEEQCRRNGIKFRYA